MTYQTIRLEERRSGIARLILARAEKRNALNAEMIRELTHAAHLIDQSRTIRAVILEAEGSTFSAGGDLNWMRAQQGRPEAERVSEGMTLATMLRALDDLSKPLIAKVHGNAFGGGIGMMCVADIVIASDRAVFGLTETRLGLIPATIGPFVVRRIGEGAARRLFMNSKIFDGAVAVETGLASAVVPDCDLDQRVEAEASAFLDCAPGAVADAKAFAKYCARTKGDLTAYTSEKLAARWANPEAAEGIAAFFEKRKAAWMAAAADEAPFDPGPG